MFVMSVIIYNSTVNNMEFSFGVLGRLFLEKEMTTNNLKNDTTININNINSDSRGINNDRLSPSISGTRIPYAYSSLNPTIASASAKIPVKLAIVLHCKILTYLYKNNLITKETLKEHLSYLFDKIWVEYNLRVIESVPIEKIQSHLPKNFNQVLFLKDTKILAYLQKYPNYITLLNNNNTVNNNVNNNVNSINNNYMELKKSKPLASNGNSNVGFSNNNTYNNNNNHSSFNNNKVIVNNKKRKFDQK
ncbi:hypothetical protein DICPUDRAFT_83193 [Dictyostelium purpureum]|uniref:Uncharacterized protein n=1 Tax=Dictyostelium purpureum TaxID=5786 RepID=F0ZYT8_DICPU|nr:uncharacterized protein DICPUDRAFT_83193 [Dictyostelium purpureum]EGC30886.1 hypothetical protein DICPUDRAFT_83193 [Dictyostelium purpureum]|eukprot:XP_003292591.1 hypothetical protein DICPUDRAFT_83193 [Dictyostelium purpureum]